MFSTYTHIYILSLMYHHIFITTHTRLRLQTTDVNSLSLSELQRKQYSIRLATMSDRDISALYDIEQKCWAKELQVDENEIKMRVARYPAGQWLAVVVEEGVEKIVGGTSNCVWVSS